MKKIGFLKKFIALCAASAIGVLVSSSGLYAQAETPYKTFTFNGYKEPQETQTAYSAVKTINKLGNEFLAGPNDMCIGEDGKIYVADTENSRVLVGDFDGNLLKIIGKGKLNTPMGVFADKNGNVYVADRDANAVFEFDADGRMLHEYGKPDSPLYGNDLQFLPLKIVVNDAGIMYIVCESNTNGIVEISPADGGTFLGYFGTNYASSSIKQIIYRAILTDEQRAKMVANIPATPDNLAIDDRGLIYTVTRGDEGKTLKRLNIAGTNLITDLEGYPDIPAACTAGNHNNVYVVDQQGYIFEYNDEGEILFIFGGPDDGTQRVGLSSMVSAISVDSKDRIYILDHDKSQIQVYEPTEFTNLLHEALNMYSEGRYTESKEPLQKVLNMNSLFDYANKAMGRAYFQEENYSQALHYARLAKDYEGYSDAFWEIRNKWLRKYIVPLILIIAALVIARKIVRYLDKKKHILDGYRNWKAGLGKYRVLSDLGYAKYFMKHPIDASYGISREGRASWKASTIILAIFTAEFVINKYLCGFLQKTIHDGRYEIVSDIGTVLVVIAALTICNYLVCTINDGRATPQKIYTYFCYSLMPYVYLTPVIFILSHITTSNEAFLITMVQVIMYTWMIVLAVVSMKEVNDYTPGETTKVILLTAFTILIMALLIFIIYVLWAQVIQFVAAIIGEVGYRIGF